MPTLARRPTEWPPRSVDAALEAVRHQLLAVLDDCHGMESDRLRWRVHTAERGQELWLLRDAVFEVVALQHSRQQAVQRIDGLEPAFRAVLPGRVLARV
jgi:hypothetical protein